MKIGDRPLLQWIRARTLEAARFHAELDFAHVLKILRQNQAEILNDVGFPIVRAVIKLAVERRLLAGGVPDQRPNVVYAGIGIGAVGACSIGEYAVVPHQEQDRKSTRL